MAGTFSLIGATISSTFKYVVQVRNDNYYDGLGNPLNIGGGGTGSGSQGPQGPSGATGFQGIQGSIGFQGNTGSQGIQGSIGLQGNTGSQGIQGSIGLQGNTGATGFQGIQGSIGLQGNTGSIGLQGNTGATGLQGNTGSIGLQGNTGATGLQGNTGATGLQGIQGSIGLQGNTGATGFQGIQGSIGLQGNTGATGSQGIQGSIGFQGNTGSGASILNQDGTITVVQGATNSIVSINLGHVNSWTGSQAGAFTIISSSASILMNFSATNNFIIGLTSNSQISTPINVLTAQSGIINVIQINSPSTLSYAWPFQFVGGTIPVLTSGTGSFDSLVYMVNYSTASNVTLINGTPNLINWTNNNLTNYSRIQLTGTFSGGITASTTYYIVGSGSNFLKLAPSLVNAAAGSFIGGATSFGILSAQAMSITVVPNLNII